jgi:hypothetical protein
VQNVFVQRTAVRPANTTVGQEWILAKVLSAGGHRWGVAAICIGVGQALAVVLENVAPQARR